LAPPEIFFALPPAGLGWLRPWVEAGNGKKDWKIAQLSLYLLYLYHVWKFGGRGGIGWPWL